MTRFFSILIFSFAFIRCGSEGEGGSAARAFSFDQAAEVTDVDDWGAPAQDELNLKTSKSLSDGVLSLSDISDFPGEPILDTGMIIANQVMGVSIQFSPVIEVHRGDRIEDHISNCESQAYSRSMPLIQNLPHSEGRFIVCIKFDQSRAKIAKYMISPSFSIDMVAPKILDGFVDLPSEYDSPTVKLQWHPIKDAQTVNVGLCQENCTTRCVRRMGLKKDKTFIDVRASGRYLACLQAADEYGNTSEWLASALNLNVTLPPSIGVFAKKRYFQTREVVQIDFQRPEDYILENVRIYTRKDISPDLLFSERDRLLVESFPDQEFWLDLTSILDVSSPSTDVSLESQSLPIHLSTWNLLASKRFHYGLNSIAISGFVDQDLRDFFEEDEELDSQKIKRETQGQKGKKLEENEGSEASGDSVNPEDPYFLDDPEEPSQLSDLRQDGRSDLTGGIARLDDGSHILDLEEGQVISFTIRDFPIFDHAQTRFADPVQRKGQFQGWVSPYAQQSVSSAISGARIEVNLGNIVQ